MYGEQGISTFPRNYREGGYTRSEPPSQRAVSGYNKYDMNDLKFSLDRDLLDSDRQNGSEAARSRRHRNESRRNTTGVTEYELQQNRMNSPAVHTVKDQEWLIQDLKKENFDLKLRLFMEQKEREKLMNGNNRQAVDLEVDLAEALDELEHAMDKENQLTSELNTARRREKTLTTKLKRLERVCQQQEEDIIRMSVELENLKMEMAAKDSGIASPSALRGSRMQNRASNGRLSPTSDMNDRYSDRLSSGYPDRYWDHFSDRGSDSGSYVTTPKDRKGFFNERFGDDVSTSDESEVRNRVALSSHSSDVERTKRREKLLSRRVKNYQDVEDKEDTNDNEGDQEDSNKSTNQGTPGYNSDYQERGVDVTPELLATHSDRASNGKLKGFSPTRWFARKQKGNKANDKSKSMDELDTIGRVDIKNIHKKNKKYNFWGCVRARESVNENIRSEYAPVKRPQLTPGKPVENNNSEKAETRSAGTPVDYI